MPPVLVRKNIKLTLNLTGSQSEGAPQVQRNELSESILCSITSELNKSHKSLKSQFPPWHAETLELLYILNGEKYLMVLLSSA